MKSGREGGMITGRTAERKARGKDVKEREREREHRRGRGN